MRSKLNQLVTVFLLCSGSILWASCDKIKDAASKDVVVKSIKVNIDDVTVGSVLRAGLRAGSEEPQLSSFSASRTLKFSELEGMSDDIKKYDPSHFKVISVGESSLVVTPVEGHGTVVKNFSIVAGTLSYNVASYTFGDTYSDSGLVLFTFELLEQIRKAKDGVLVTVKGETDVPDGEHVNVKLTLNNVTFNISLF
ncbi:MAG: hypothetical protein LBN71_04795 [Tannerella sp.]|jgi:hypothetical protein|nr:hypothetical protein [Tannerella sp.]